MTVRRAAVSGLAIAALVVIVFAVAAIPLPDEAPPEAFRSADEVGILVAPPPPEGILDTIGCPLMDVHGELREEAGVGLVVGDTVVVWPSGYGGRREGAAIAIVDEHGDVVARTGDTVAIVGGSLGPEGRFWACREVTITRPG